MKRNLWWTSLLIAVIAANGCVERRYLVTTDPPGAMVFVNGQPVGATPVDVCNYTYYGKYHLTIIKDGYETLQVDQPVPAPWFEWPPLDFFAETVYPFKIRDVRSFPYQLQPAQRVGELDVLNRGRTLRERGLAVQPLPDGVPQPKRVAPTNPPGPIVPPPQPPGTIVPPPQPPGTIVPPAVPPGPVVSPP